MSERMRYQPPEEESRPLPKTADFHYAYRGYYDEGGICRVRLFQDTRRPPVMLVSQLEENRNTSITNKAEYIGAEIGAKHFPERFEARDPFLFLEHYRYPEETDPTLREIWSTVRFDSYTPRWTYLPPPEVARLIGPVEMADRGEDGR